MELRKFKLLRYFSLANMLATLVASVLLGWLYRQTAIRDLKQTGEASNTALAQAFSNTLWPQFSQFLLEASKLSPDEIRFHPTTAKLDQVIQKMTQGQNVVKVKIYVPNGLTVYSSEHSQIGIDMGKNGGFQQAMSGHVTIDLTRRNQFNTFDRVIENRDLLSSYVPVRGSQGQIEAVFELYSDLTPTLQKIDKTQRQVFSGGFLILSLLYGALWFFIKYADAIIRRQEDALALAKNKAETASRIKSEFLATISHELRTPMHGVLGMTELLQETPLDTHQRSFLETIRHSGEALLSVINNTLDFSKIEAGKIEFESHPFNLRTLIEDLGVLFARASHAKGLELVCALEPKAPTQLQGDMGRLRQVLINLIGNAVKFTEHGEILVRVNVLEQKPDNALFHFEVQDTGIGIAPENIERIFDSFSQADNTTTRRFGGTGLGLTITKRLVELMGGQLKVKSTPGKGSNFHFELRLALDKAQVPVDRPALRELDGLRVLVIDDNDTHRDVLASQLTSWGIRHRGANNAENALTLLSTAVKVGDPFHIAILDMHLPAKNGSKLIEELKRDSGPENLRIIVLTNVEKSEAADSLEPSAILSQLTKPVRQSELYESLAGAAPPPPPTTKELSTHGRLKGRILLVEDNGTNQVVARTMLENLGLSVDCAANGAEAMDKTTQNLYDLILMDCQMPVMDGFAATAAIRAKAGDPSRLRPIIALTANTIKGDRERCLAAGMNDYLGKPFNQTELHDTLKKWL